MTRATRSKAAAAKSVSATKEKVKKSPMKVRKEILAVVPVSASSSRRQRTRAVAVKVRTEVSTKRATKGKTKTTLLKATKAERQKITPTKPITKGKAKKTPVKAGLVNAKAREVTSKKPASKSKAKKTSVRSGQPLTTTARKRRVTKSATKQTAKTPMKPGRKVKAVATASAKGSRRPKAEAAKVQASRRTSIEPPRVLDDDEYIYCDRCERDYEGACPKHGKLQYVVDRTLPEGYAEADRAKRTAPSVLAVAESGVERGDLGVWTRVPLEVGVTFGPFEGVRTAPEDFSGSEDFSFKIRRNHEVVAILDGSDPTKGNWMRYVKCAEFMDQQNIMPFQFQGKFYFRTCREVPMETELLMYTRAFRRSAGGYGPPLNFLC